MLSCQILQVIHYFLQKYSYFYSSTEYEYLTHVWLE